ncbi:MAG: hypothetical protein CL878_02480 [Dehalococcoidia bacterium]|nr:hypothetical protein [Dehalococcoidia bacterium]
MTETATRKHWEVEQGMEPGGQHYRAGLIGCGRMSRHHIPALMATPGVELVALADPYQPALDERGEQFGVASEHRYADYREMLDRESLDIVTISTQAPEHAPATLSCVDAGVRGVLCEKPIALSLAEADEMVAACDRTGMKLAINHQTRISLATYRAEELIQSGAIGEFVGVRIVDKGGRPAGNSLMEMATHLFDHTRLYAGDPTWVAAHLTDAEPDGHRRPSTVDDIMYSQTAWPADRDCGLVLGSRATAVFGFGPASLHNGLEASFVSYNQPGDKSWPDQLELIGIEGVLALRTSGESDLFLHRGAWGAPVQFEPVLTGADAQHTEPVLPAGLAPERVTGRLGSFVAMLTELKAAIEEDRPHRSDVRDGRWALDMIMGVYESHRQNGARVALPLPQREHPLERWLNDEGRPMPHHPEPTWGGGIPA